MQRLPKPGLPRLLATFPSTACIILFIHSRLYYPSETLRQRYEFKMPEWEENDKGVRRPKGKEASRECVIQQLLTMNNRSPLPKRNPGWPQNVQDLSWVIPLRDSPHSQKLMNSPQPCPSQCADPVCQKTPPEHRKAERVSGRYRWDPKRLLLQWLLKSNYTCLPSPQLVFPLRAWVQMASSD